MALQRHNSFTQNNGMSSNTHLPSSNLPPYLGTEGFLSIQRLDFSNTNGYVSHEDNPDFQDFSSSQVSADLYCLMNVDGSRSDDVASPLSFLHSEDVLAPSHFLPTPQEKEIENIPSFATTSISDPASIQVIRNLSRIRLSRTDRLPFDSTLVLAKQGLKIVQSCLPDKQSPQSGPFSSQEGSTTLALACIHVMDLVLASYAVLHFQIKQNSQSSSSGLVRIGEFHVEGDEIRHQLLLLVLVREIQRCKEDVGSRIQLSLSPGDDITGGLPLDQFAENGHWPNQKQGFVHSVLHQLHCVGVLTHDLIKLKGGDTLTEKEYGHMGHCIEYIRHAIMCYGDTTLEKPRDNSGPRATGYDTIHMCRDWTVLSDFLWGASIGFKSGPTGLPIVFENVDAAQGNPNGRMWDFE